jgi:hypothetical protein
MLTLHSHRNDRERERIVDQNKLEGKCWISTYLYRKIDSSLHE